MTRDSATTPGTGFAGATEMVHPEIGCRMIGLRPCHVPPCAGAEAIRERIERNLHDGMQQRLVSVAMSLGLLDAKLPAEPDAAKRIAREARQRLALALEELRELTQGGDPAAVAERGLEGALNELCRGAGIAAHLSLSLNPRLPAAVEAAAYYVVSEALTNAVKHAHARKLRVAAWSEGEVFLVEIADDGDGGANPDGGSGLKGLTARVEALGGRLHVSSPIGKGTTVRARIPCRWRVTPRLPADRDGKVGAYPVGRGPAQKTS